MMHSLLKTKRKTTGVESHLLSGGALTPLCHQGLCRHNREKYNKSNTSADDHSSLQLSSQSSIIEQTID